MTNLFEQHRLLNAAPEHLAHWQQVIAETEPSVLARDYAGQDRDAPSTQLAVDLHPAAAAEVEAIANGDRMLVQLVHTAILVLLTCRATDQERVTVLTPAPDGAAVPALPLTVAVPRGGTFRELLAATRSAYLDAAPRTTIPIWELYDRAGHRPTDVALGIDERCTAEDTSLLGSSLHFEIDDARVQLTYRNDLFSAGTARRLATDYARLLATAVAEREGDVGRLLDADEEDRRLLADFNDTGREFPMQALLHEYVEQQARLHPDWVAIADDGTTYAEFNREVNRLAHNLRARGVGPGEIVGVCLPRSKRELTAIYAVLKAGGCYLPIDAALPRNRVEYMLENSGARLVLGDAAARDVVTSQVEFVDLDSSTAFSDDDSDPDPVADASSLCYLIYTSGSTGRPKGVMIEHRAIVNRLVWMQRAYPLTDADTILHKTPFTFDVSVWEIFWWSIAGASVATLPSGAERDPEHVAARISEHGVTTMHFVPSMLQAFTSYVTATETMTGLRSLRTVFASGEALSTYQATRFHDLFDQVRLINLYGPTEAAVDVSHFDTGQAEEHRALPIGRPIDNIQLQVLNRSGKLAPIGTPGELCITGTGLARGYRNAPELTEQRFHPSPVDPAERMYRTGDLARWTPEGVLEYLGRIDTQVKIRGYRIELGEIEHVARRFAAVTDCAITAIGSAEQGYSLCAYVVPGEGFDAAALSGSLSSELPTYMVPQWIIEVPSIPTNHNGKRDLTGLPAPDRDGGAAYLAPRNDLERTLAHVWRSVLNVDRLGVNDNFFALGGDSIKFIAALAAAREAGLEFTFQDLFANPSIAGLATVAKHRDAVATTTEQLPFALLNDTDRASVPPGAVDAYPMSALQVGLLYEAARAKPGSGLYHDILSYRIDGSVDPATFCTAVELVAARHAIMRTSFHLDGFSEPVQVVHGHVPCPLEIVDLTDSPEAEQEAELRDFAARELAAGFRSGAPDMIRVRLHLLGARGYQYTLSYHDAALDGWSVNTIHRDIFETYFALLDGIEPPTADISVSYRDFVEAEREAIASSEQRQYWLGVLSDYESTRLPRWGRTTNSGDVVLHDVALPEQVAEGIVRTATALRVPVKSVLLAAHVAVVGFVAGTGSVLTGYEHSGRPEVLGGAELPGLFLNTVPFGVELGNRTWAELVDEVYRNESAMLPNRRFPMMEMKKAVGTREPLFESVFNFTHFHVLKDLSARDGFGMVRSVVNAQTEFPFRAEFSQDAITDQVQLALHYHSDVFAPEQITRIGGYYARALEQLASNTGQDVRTSTLLDAAELAELTTEFTGPQHELPPGTFVDRFAAQATAAPDTVALVHGEVRLTYEELDDASDRVAGHLREHGVEHGTVVTTLLDRGVEWAVTVLALFKMGAVYLPQEPSYPTERLASVLRRSGSRHLVTDRTAAEPVRVALSAVMPEAPAIITPVAGDPLREGCRPDPDDTAYIIFTSGSTGEPKGAAIRHSGMLNHLLAKSVDLGLTEADRIVQLATQCFDISVWQLLAAWLAGGRTVLIGQDVVTDPGALLRVLTDEEATVLEVVPSYLDALLAEVEARPVELPSLRYNMVTGEAVPPGLTSRWFDSYDIPLVNAYGPTEASDDVTHHVLVRPVRNDRVPVGRAVLNTGLHVVDEYDRRCPLGTFGEIVVTGIGVGLGYVNDRERTDAVFTPNVLDDRSATMYRTGDVGRWLPDGLLDCAGRVDHQVKVRGFRIELSEIEGAFGLLPGVDSAVVILDEATPDKQLAAFYTGTAEYDVTAVRDGLSASLPSYMYPDSVRRLDAFPLTGNGKVDRAALAELVVAAPAERVREAPADEHERALAEVFAEVIGVDAEEVGATDNFFDVGGHSVAAMKVVVKLGDAVTLRDLLAHPSVRTLSRYLRGGSDSDRSLLVDLTLAAGFPDTVPAFTLVCVPFAGGSAVSYLDLARELHPAGIRVLGVELPARSHSNQHKAVPADVLGADLAAEIATTVTTPVALLGHCAGTGPVLTAASALRARGVAVERLFLVAKVLKSAVPADHTTDEVMAMSEDEILEWLGDNTGFEGFGRLSPAGRSDLARAFRYDTAEATRAFATALAESKPPQFPITALYAADDTLVRGHELAAKNWERFGPLRVRVTESGGHYLNTTRVGFLAACVREEIGDEQA